MLRRARNDGARGNGIVLQFTSSLQAHARVLAAHPVRALLAVPRSPKKKGAGKAGCRLAPAVCCAKGTRRKPHSSIQVKPNTRPSLRDGRTAYAVLSREPSSFWPPSPFELTMPSARLGSRTSSIRLDRSNDGQDHTVLPYAAHPASPKGFAGLRRRSSARGFQAHGDYPPCPPISCRRCCVHRNPARVSNDSRTAPLRRAGLCRSMP